MSTNPIAVEIFFFLLGLIFGSFATMASYRLIHGGSFFTRSKCPKCKHQLGVKDLFPLFSYLVQGGKCRYCQKKISRRYPLTEFVTGTAFFLIATQYGDIPVFAALLCAITLAFIIMIVTDFEEYIIPDEIQISLAILGVLFSYYKGYSLMQIILMPILLLSMALLLKYGFKFLMKKDGLGMGDVKFFAVAGLYLTPESASAFFLLSGLIGILTAIVWRLLKKGEVFPFGPSLAIALYIIIVFPKAVNIANFLAS